MTSHRTQNTEDATIPLGISQIFGTPLFIGQPKQVDEALNTALHQLILEKEKSSAGVMRSNINGWQSERDLLRCDAPEIKKLMNMFLGSFGLITANYLKIPAEKLDARFELTAWANVIRQGAYNAPHTHAGKTTWSAIYYVSAGDICDEETYPSGLLQLEDPRANAHIPGLSDDIGQSIQIIPESGRIVVFPGWLTHFVHPYQGKNERVSIACNAELLEITQN